MTIPSVLNFELLVFMPVTGTTTSLRGRSPARDRGHPQADGSNAVRRDVAAKAGYIARLGDPPSPTMPQFRRRGTMCSPVGVSLLCASVTALASLDGASGARAKQPSNVYATYGVHNEPSYSSCQKQDCIYPRSADQPTDPRYPDYWTTHWKMYRIWNGYRTYPPPYDQAPPSALQPGRDYEASDGVTYYDNTWRGASGQGAIFDHYEKRCLPIFPTTNQFTCSFVSLGDVTVLLTYPQDRPDGMPPACLFSPLNHPPRPDFVKYLPYSEADSMRLADRVQAYSFWIGAADGQIKQVGVMPDRTDEHDILFGYAFSSAATPDRVERMAPPYRHPQSFYFSGYPLLPPNGPNAPLVSQIYTDFAMIKPDPKATWDLVKGLDPKTIPACHLMDPPRRAPAAARAPTWGDLHR